jgi:hypothetical protein
VIVLIGRVLGFGLLLLQGAIGIGLLISLGEIALGRRGGYRHLGGVALAMTVVWLWEAGQLAAVLTDLVSQLVTGHPAPSPLGSLR